MRIIKIDGRALTTLGLDGATSPVTMTDRSEPGEVETSFLARVGGESRISAVTPQPRRLHAIFKTPTMTERKAVLKALRWPTPRSVWLTLESQDSGNPEMEVPAVPSPPRLYPDRVEVNFEVPWSFFRAPSETEVDGGWEVHNRGVDGAFAAILPIEVTGHGEVELGLAVSPTAPVGGAYSVSDTCSAYRMVWTVTNTSSQPITNYPYYSPTFDGKAMIAASKCKADGSDIRVYRDGRQVQREVVNLDSKRAYVLIRVDHIAAGESITYDIMYGAPTVSGTTRRLSSSTYARTHQPAFLYEGDTGSATSGSTTTLNDTGKSWTTNEWLGARVYFLTGANAISYKTITGNTATQLQFGAASNAIVAGVEYAIEPSSNTRWNYQMLRGSYADRRGMYYADDFEDAPRIIDYGNPGAWRPNVWRRNDDDYTQARVSLISGDYYPILDVRRRASSRSMYPEEGFADGLALTCPGGISQVEFAYEWKNVNGPCKFVLGYRSEYGEDWTGAWSDTTTQAALNPFGIVTQALSDNPKEIAFAVVPANDDVISSDKKRTDEAQARLKDQLIVTLSSPLSSSLGAEEDATDLSVQAYIDGRWATAKTPHANIKLGTNLGMTLPLKIDEEEFRVEGSSLVSASYVSSTGVKVRDMPWAARIYQSEEDELGNVRARFGPRWMPVLPSSNPITNPDFAAGITNWTKLTPWAGSDPGGSFAASWDNTVGVKKLDGSGSFGSMKWVLTGGHGKTGDLLAYEAAGYAQVTYGEYVGGGIAVFGAPGAFTTCGVSIHFAWYDDSDVLLGYTAGDNQRQAGSWTSNRWEFIGATARVGMDNLGSMAYPTATRARLRVVLYCSSGAGSTTLWLDKGWIGTSWLCLKTINHPVKVWYRYRPLYAY